MKNNPAVSEAVTAYLEAHPGSAMGAICENVLAQGLSTPQGIQSVMRNLVRAGAVIVTGSHDRRKYRYTLNEDARTIKVTHASRFEVPPELAGPIVPPMVWSMRHLLGAHSC